MLKTKGFQQQIVQFTFQSNSNIFLHIFIQKRFYNKVVTNFLYKMKKRFLSNFPISFLCTRNFINISTFVCIMYLCIVHCTYIPKLIDNWFFTQIHIFSKTLKHYKKQILIGLLKIIGILMYDIILISIKSSQP